MTEDILNQQIFGLSRINHSLQLRCDDLEQRVNELESMHLNLARILRTGRPLRAQQEALRYLETGHHDFDEYIKHRGES